MNRTLIIASYKIPKEKGFCGTNTTKGYPEHCRCQSPFEDITTCKARCDDDIGCIAFTFDFQSKNCYLATQTLKEVCEKRKDCTKNNGGDWVDACELVEVKSEGATGCFIKKKGDRNVHNRSLTQIRYLK